MPRLRPNAGVRECRPHSKSYVTANVGGDAMTARITRVLGAGAPGRVTAYLARQIDQMQDALAYYGQDSGASCTGRALWKVYGDGPFCRTVDGQVLSRETLHEALAGQDTCGYQVSTPAANALTFLDSADPARTAEAFREARLDGQSVADAARTVAVSEADGWRIDLALGGWRGQRDQGRFTKVGKLLGGERASVQEVLALASLAEATHAVQQLRARIDTLGDPNLLTARQRRYLAQLTSALAEAQNTVYAHVGAAGQRVQEVASELLEEGSAQRRALSVIVTELAAKRTMRNELHTVDITFSAPKSVSVLMALGTQGQADRIAAIQRDSVDAALGLLNQEVGFGRRGKAGVNEVAIAKMRAALVTQLDSRTGDPQLHTHTILQLVAQMDDGGRSGIETDAMFKASKHIGQYFHTALRRRMSEEFGVAWTAVNSDGQGEIVGMPQELLDHFSGRTLEIVEALPGFALLTKADRQAWDEVRDNELLCEAAARKHAEGLLLDEEEQRLVALYALRNRIEKRIYECASQGEIRAAANESRDEKTGLNESQVRARAQAHHRDYMANCYMPTIDAILNKTHQWKQEALADMAKQSVITDEMLITWVRDIQSERAHFGRADIYERIVVATTEMNIAETDLLPLVRRAVEVANLKVIRGSDRQGSWLSHTNGRGELLVTPEHLHLETKIADKWARLSANRVSTGIGRDQVAEVIVTSIMRDGQVLNADERAYTGQALFAAHILQGDSVVCLAAAGTGKSHAVKATVPLLQGAGRLVIATAPSAVAAAGLGEDAGADVVANTHLLVKLLRGGRIAARYDSMTAEQLTALERVKDTLTIEQYVQAGAAIKEAGVERKNGLELAAWRTYGRLISTIDEVKDIGRGDQQARRDAMKPWTVADIDDGRDVTLVKIGTDHWGDRVELARRTVTASDLAAEPIRNLAGTPGHLRKVSRKPAPKRGNGRAGLDANRSGHEYTGAVSFGSGTGSRSKDTWVYVGRQVAEVLGAYQVGSTLNDDHVLITALRGREASLAANTTDEGARLLAAVRAELHTLTSWDANEDITAEKAAALVRRMAELEVQTLAQTEELLRIHKIDSCDLTVFVDEAGMASTEILAELTELCDPGQHQMVLLGDTAQLGSVRSAGGMFRYLAEQEDTTTVVLEDIQRLGGDVRKDPQLHHAAQQAREGQPGAQAALDHLAKEATVWEAAAQVAMSNITRGGERLSAAALEDKAQSIAAAYQDHNRIRAVELVDAGPDQPTSREVQRHDLLNSYVDALRHGETAIMLSADNRTTRALNAAFVEDQREWSNRVRAARVLAAQGWPGAREDLAQTIEENRTSTGQLFTEVGAEEIWLNQDQTSEDPDRRQGREYRAGERIMIRANARKLGLNNGDTMTIVGLTDDCLVVRKDDGTIVRIPPDGDDATICRDLHHAYASTIHKSQGGTWDRAFIDISEPAGWHRELLYVAASRGRVENTFYGIGDAAEVRDHIAAAIKRSDDDDSALGAMTESQGPDTASRIIGLGRIHARTARLLGQNPKDIWNRDSQLDTILDEGRARHDAARALHAERRDTKVTHAFRHNEAKAASARATKEERNRSQHIGRGAGLDIS